MTDSHRHYPRPLWISPQPFTLYNNAGTEWFAAAMVLPHLRLLTNTQTDNVLCFCRFSDTDSSINSAAYVSFMIYLFLPPPPCVALGKSFILLDQRIEELGGRDLRDHQSRPFIISIRITATAQTT